MSVIATLMDIAALQTQNQLLQQQVSLLSEALQLARIENALLRQKLDKEFDKPLLKTVRGAGYMLDEPEQDFPG